MSGFDFKELEQFRDNLLAMREHVPEIMEELVVGEGVYAVKQVRSICKQEGIVNTGQYRMNWHAGNRANPAEASGKEHDGSAPRKQGTSYTIDVYNNVDYAKHLEYGFRSHYVPAKHLSGKYRQKFPDGLYVGTPGGYVKGRFVLKRAIKRTEITQKARLSRKWNQKVKEYCGRGL